MNTEDKDGKQLFQPKFWAICEQQGSKKLKYKTSYSKATDNIATICMIYEGKKKKAVLNFTSSHSIMDYFVSMKILKLYKLESG